MDVPAHVGLRVVDHVVVVLGQPVVGREGIGVESRAGGDVLADFGVEHRPTTVWDDCGADLARPLATVALQQPHDGRLVLTARAVDLRGALVRVHELGLAADEGLVRLHVTVSLARCPSSWRRMRWSMNHADFCDAQRPADLVRADAVLRAEITHMAVSHGRGRGRISKMVRT